MPGPSQYRQLDDARILAPLTRLRDGIAERFPNSYLSRLAGNPERIDLESLTTGLPSRTWQRITLREGGHGADRRTLPECAR